MPLSISFHDLGRIWAPALRRLDNLGSADHDARGLMESLRLLPDDYVHIYLGRLVQRPLTVILAVSKTSIISEAAPVAGWLVGSL